MKKANFFPSFLIYAIVIVSPLKADIAGKLNAINEKEAEDKTQLTVSALIPFLHNITELVGNIRESFDKWSQKNNPNRLHRQALSGCELIPADALNDTTEYFLCEKEVNWYMARRHCASHGMRLATVDREAIYNKLAPFVKIFIEQKGWESSGFWIGGTDLGSEGNWYWTSNGAFLKWSKWFPGEPHNEYKGKTEDCLALWKFGSPKWKFDWIGFNDYVCDFKVPFICELY